MDMNDLKRVNSLWTKLYPFLAAQIMESYQRNSIGTVLELGPFSGGISVALARLHPKLHITIADESRVLNDRLGRRRVTIKELEEMVSGSGLSGKCTIEEAGGVWLNINK